jgi:H+/Cl- antiporter ClcA
VINWSSVLINSFWIVGLAILLAAFSYHYWQATSTNQKLKAQLNRPGFLRPFWVSLILISIGLAGTSTTWWETTIWAIFTGLNAINLMQVGK